MVLLVHPVRAVMKIVSTLQTHALSLTWMISYAWTFAFFAKVIFDHTEFP